MKFNSKLNVNEFEKGEKVWIVPGYRYLIAIQCTIEEVDDRFRKEDSDAYLFYDVDEPIGHNIAEDEIFLTREDAEEELFARYEEELECDRVKADITLKEFREGKIKFIVETWEGWRPEDYNEETHWRYPDKKEKEEWFNFDHLKEKPHE